MADWERDVFHPEEIDEQIDEYLSQSHSNEQKQNTTTHAVMQALQFHFVPPGQSAALQRVWQRFEQKRSSQRSIEQGQRRIALQRERRHKMKSIEGYSHKKNNSSLIHRLGLIAAVFVVALLIGSMAIVLQLAPDRQTRLAQSGNVSEKMMFATFNGTLYRLDTTTHQPLWQFKVPSGTDGSPGMILSQGQVFSDTYYISGKTGRTGNSNPNKFYALDVTNGQIRWQRDITSYLFVTTTIFDTTLYLSMKKDGHLTVIALDTRSGATKWESRLEDKENKEDKTVEQTVLPPESFIKLLAASDKAVYGAIIAPEKSQSDGMRFALNAHNGNVLWQKNEDIANMDQGFLVNGLLCVAKEISTERDANGLPPERQGFLMGYDAESGEQRWSKQLDGPPSMYGTTVLNDIIYLNTNRIGQVPGNSVYAFSTQDGSLIWQYRDTDKLGSSSPTVTEKGIYINRYGETGEQTLVALDTKSGKVHWTYKFRDGITVEYPPAADNERVYLSLPENKVQILQASDGKPVGSFKIEGQVDPNNRPILQIIE